MNAIQFRLTGLLACFACISAIASGCASAQPSTDQSTEPVSFADPAVPTVNVCVVERVPLPVNTDGLTYHNPPKPHDASSRTEDWPIFLGPRRNAISHETNLSKELGEDGPPLVWETRVGEGYSAPVILGDRLIMFHRIDDVAVIDCIHPETGKRYWRHQYPTDYRDRYGFNGGPRGSAVIDGDRVYVHGVEGKLLCLQLQTGCVIWQRNLSVEFKIPQEYFGVGSTPLVEGDLLIVNLGAPKGPCVAAFDKYKGKLVWGTGDDWGASYASPVAATIHNNRFVFTFAGGDSRPPTGGLIAVDPSDGRIRFEFPWRSKKYESVNAATPIVVNNDVFITASYRTGSAMLAVQPDGTHKTKWTSQDLGSHWATPIIHDGHIYGIDGERAADIHFVCLNAESGKLLWRERVEWQAEVQTSRGKQAMLLGPMRSTLIHADGHFLCLGERGDLLWLDMTPEGIKILSRASLFTANETYAPPVVVRGLLYILQTRRDRTTRSDPRLICYDLRRKE